jgi:hypothetical protein
MFDALQDAIDEFDAVDVAALSPAEQSEVVAWLLLIRAGMAAAEARLVAELRRREHPPG